MRGRSDSKQQWPGALKLPDSGKGRKGHPRGVKVAEVPPDRHISMAGRLAGILQVIGEMPSGERSAAYIANNASRLARPSSAPIRASEVMEHG